MVSQIFGNAVVQNIEEADLFERGAEFRRSLFGRSVFAREEWTQVKDRDVFVRRGTSRSALGCVLLGLHRYFFHCLTHRRAY
jgi:hypothetical protein